MTVDELRRLVEAAESISACEACVQLACEGWEAEPGGFDGCRMEQVGSLVVDAGADATLEEYHPSGTTLWSADAPIALDFFPYNRSSVWRCQHCARVYLRYTEYGGYYQEARIRHVRRDVLLNGAT